MIEINLLPEQLRQTHQKQAIMMQTQVFLNAIPVILGLLVFVHLLLAGVFLFKSIHYSILNKRWDGISQQRQKVNEWRRQFNLSSQYSEQMGKFLTERITMADKLHMLSKSLPNGIWFNNLSIEENIFSLKGTVVSLEKKEMGLLNQYLDRLKQNNPFFKDFKSLELGRVKMRTLSGFSVMDFVLEGEFK